jgi:hypothetical protein
MDPYTLKVALNAVLAVKRTADAAKLKRQVRDIEDSVQLLGATLNQALVTDLLTAYDHLVASQRAANEGVRREELANARASFARLIRRPPTGPVAADSTELTHEQLVALGHQGSFYYFLLSDDPQQALEQAYSCATKFPLLAIRMFPCEIFTQDYNAALHAITERAATNRALALAAHRWAMEGYRQERRGYLLEMAWKMPLAAGAAIAGLAGAAVVPSMAGRGVQAAIGIMSGIGDRSVVPPSCPRSKIVDSAEPETAGLMSRISTEAAESLEALQR